MRHAGSAANGGTMRMSSVQAVILCGGLGTRLSGVVPDLPQALAPVAGRPFLDYVLENLAAAGIRDIVLCTSHRGEQIEAAYVREASCGLSVAYSTEPALPGTAGALTHAAPLIQGNPFLLLNGSSLLEVDLEPMLAAHLASGASATVALTRVLAPERYGIVSLDPNGEIRAFSEKKAAVADDRSDCDGTLVNAGVYLLDRRLLQRIPAAPPAVSFEHQVLPGLIGQGLFGFVTDGFFVDIRVPEDYRRAQTEIPKRADHACSHTH